MSSPENHPDTPIPASTAVIGEDVNLKNAGSQTYTTAILKSLHLEELLGHQAAYRDFELKAKAEKTKKGSKMTWIRQNITTSFINNHKLGEIYNLSTVYSVVQRFFYNHGVAKTPEIVKKQKPAASKPSMKKGIDVFGVDKKNVIHEKDEVGEEEKAQYETAADALNEKMKEGPPAAEIYKNQASIIENTAFALAPILGHSWGGHGDVALFVMGVYRDRSNVLKRFSFSTSEKEQAPVFSNRIPDVIPGLRKDLRTWGEDVFPVVLDDGLVHVEAADSDDAEGPQLPELTDETTDTDIQRLLLEFGVRLYEWAGREVPDGADNIFIRLVRRDQLEEGAFEEFRPQRMTADECKKLYGRLLAEQEAEATEFNFYFSKVGKLSKPPVVKPGPTQPADYTLVPRGTTTPTKPFRPASPAPPPSRTPSPSPSSTPAATPSPVACPPSSVSSAAPDVENGAVKGKGGKVEKEKAAVAPVVTPKAKGRRKKAVAAAAGPGPVEGESNKRKASVTAEGAEPVGGTSKKRKRAQGEVEEKIEAPAKKGRGRPVTLKRKADTDGERGDKTKKAQVAAPVPARRSTRGTAPKEPEAEPELGRQVGKWWYPVGAELPEGFSWADDYDAVPGVEDLSAINYQKATAGTMVIKRSKGSFVLRGWHKHVVSFVVGATCCGLERKAESRYSRIGQDSINGGIGTSWDRMD
ncbi:hypothetical protein DFH09DRAFT_1094814 [Mycena vulgaris]|nr:hypothetical protein DFH09DRAFT_1094814 [Mycena vulgaris]